MPVAGVRRGLHSPTAPSRKREVFFAFPLGFPA